MGRGTLPYGVCLYPSFLFWYIVFKNIGFKDIFTLFKIFFAFKGPAYRESAEQQVYFKEKLVFKGVLIRNKMGTREEIK